MLTAAFIVGIALIAVGVGLLFRRKKLAGGRNTIEIFGLKFQVQGPALVTIVLGTVLVLFGARPTSVVPSGEPSGDTTERSQPEKRTPEFVSAYTFTAQDINQVDFRADMRAKIDRDARRLLVLEKCEFGNWGPRGKAVRVSFRFRNAANRPMTLKVQPRYFSLRDDHSRLAAVAAFAGPPAEEIVDVGQERTIVVVFDTTGWHGKEDGARKLYLAVTDLFPIAQAKWEIIPLVAGAG